MAAAIFATSVAGWATVTAAQDDPAPQDRGSVADSAGPASTAEPAAVTGPMNYYAVTPCRIFDSRVGAKYSPGQTRNLYITGDGSAGETFEAQGGTVGGCGIPWAGPTANAVMINITAVGATGKGHVRAWPILETEPNATVLNFSQALNASNGLAVPISPDFSGDIKLKVYGSSTHIVGDVVGFFAP